MTQTILSPHKHTVPKLNFQLKEEILLRFEELVVRAIEKSPLVYFYTAEKFSLLLIRIEMKLMVYHHNNDK